MSKAIAIGYLAKVSAANVNASYTEGNVLVAKKVTLPDGNALPYISGQAIRRMMRDRLADTGFELSEPFAKVSGQEVTPPVEPWKFVDEDLFGYLDSSGGRRRTSPVRVSAAVGLFPYQGDRDLGTRSFERFGETVSAGGNVFETELYANLFRGVVLVELDRIGRFSPAETGQEKEQSVDAKERQRRLQGLLDALNLLWGGGRTARMLEDLSPKFLAYTRLSVKHPVFAESLYAGFESGLYRLNTNSLCNALNKFEKHRLFTVFGVEPDVFSNEDEIRETLKSYGAVVTVHQAIQEAKKDIDQLWSESESSAL